MTNLTKRALRAQLFSFVLLIGILLSNPLLAKMPAKIDRKIDKYLKSHLKVKELERTPITFDGNKTASLDFNNYKDRLFDVKLNGKSLGFIFIENARSRYDEFTFMVFLDYDLNVQLVRVLEYNETHGVEITNKGWLSQFIGFNPDSRIQYQENVDAISGATISSKSITIAIRELLQKAKKLKAAAII